MSKELMIERIEKAQKEIEAKRETGVLPSIRVMTTLCDTSGSVYSRFSAAAAPQKELTPGQESYAIPSSSR